MPTHVTPQDLCSPDRNTPLLALFKDFRDFWVRGLHRVEQKLTDREPEAARKQNRKHSKTRRKIGLKYGPPPFVGFDEVYRVQDQIPHLHTSNARIHTCILPHIHACVFPEAYTRAYTQASPTFDLSLLAFPPVTESLDLFASEGVCWAAGAFDSNVLVATPPPGEITILPRVGVNSNRKGERDLPHATSP